MIQTVWYYFANTTAHNKTFIAMQPTHTDCHSFNPIKIYNGGLKNVALACLK